MLLLSVFVFKQKTAYEVRISDWSSDVCSSDLARALAVAAARHRHAAVGEPQHQNAVVAGEQRIDARAIGVGGRRQPPVMAGERRAVGHVRDARVRQTGNAAWRETVCT